MSLEHVLYVALVLVNLLVFIEYRSLQRRLSAMESKRMSQDEIFKVMGASPRVSPLQQPDHQVRAPHPSSDQDSATEREIQQAFSKWSDPEDIGDAIKHYQQRSKWGA